MVVEVEVGTEGGFGQRGLGKWGGGCAGDEESREHVNGIEGSCVGVVGGVS